jgi:hypothetical protein
VSAQSWVSGLTVRRLIPPGTRRALLLPAASEEARCVAYLTVAPTAVPADVIPGSPDTRTLGVILRGVRHNPPGE